MSLIPALGIWVSEATLVYIPIVRPGYPGLQIETLSGKSRMIEEDIHTCTHVLTFYSVIVLGNASIETLLN